jgi:integrase
MMMRDVWPAHDWSWLCAVQKRAQRFAEPSRNKDARIVPQQDLLRLGCELMQQAAAMSMSEDLRAGPGHPALLFRDGLIIALLAMRPLRQRNFLALQIGRCLRRDRDGWQIQIPADESKTHVVLRISFPDVLVPVLETYFALYRPRLMAMQGPRNPATAARPVGSHLWVSRCGTPMTAGGLQKALARHTRARFGHHVNVHLFRDCAATSLADDNPEHVRLAADLLGHRSFQTTQSHYISARQKSALRRCQATVLQHRKTTRHDQSEHKGRRL